MKQASIALLIALMLAIAISSPAKADLINGVCTLDMTISFDSPPTLTDTSPYTISIDETSDWSECKLDTLDPTPLVEGGGSANALQSLASCGVLAGTGTWWQGFGAGGGAPPPMLNGSHRVAGTWLHATMVVSSNVVGVFTGVIELVPHPDYPLANALAIDTCSSDEAVESIRMLGVQVFNDPEL